MDLGVFCPSSTTTTSSRRTSITTSRPGSSTATSCRRPRMRASSSLSRRSRWRAGAAPPSSGTRSLESFTLMAALGAVTSKIRLYGSVAVLTIPPPIIARMAVTINEICGGRFGVNIVSGYNKKQYDQMSVWPGDEFFSTRYDYSAEYVQILNELWTDGESNFKGEYFEMKNCKLGPLPAEEIEIVCAGRLRPWPRLHRAVRRLQLPDAGRWRRRRARGRSRTPCSARGKGELKSYIGEGVPDRETCRPTRRASSKEAADRVAREDAATPWPKRLSSAIRIGSSSSSRRQRGGRCRRPPRELLESAMAVMSLLTFVSPAPGSSASVEVLGRLAAQWTTV